MSYIFLLDTKRCVGCGACAVACMDQNDFDPKTGSAPFRTVFETEHMEEKPSFHHYSVACMHCDNAPCITACPVQCLRKDPETNLTVYDNTHCIGCHSCAMASSGPPVPRPPVCKLCATSSFPSFITAHLEVVLPISMPKVYMLPP